MGVLSALKFISTSHAVWTNSRSKSLYLQSLSCPQTFIKKSGFFLQTVHENINDWQPHLHCSHLHWQSWVTAAALISSVFTQTYIVEKQKGCDWQQWSKSWPYNGCILADSCWMGKIQAIAGPDDTTWLDNSTFFNWLLSKELDGKLSPKLCFYSELSPTSCWIK